jgi:adenylate cyclase
MAFLKDWRRAGLAALLFVGAVGLALLLPRPPSPLAAADRLFERVAWSLAAPPRAQSPDIVLAAIGDGTLSRFPYRSPIDRAFLAAMIEALDRARVRAVGLDVIFDQPTEPAKDQALLSALDRAAMPVVLLALSPETPLAAGKRRFLDQFLAGRRSGYGNLARERFDDQIRIHMPLDPASGSVSFPVAIASALGVPAPAQPFAIDWRAPPSPSVPAFATYPAEAIATLPRAWLAGKIVLIGTMLPGEDVYRTLVSGFGAPMHGVEIHAQVLSQLLEGRDRSAPGGWLLAATAAATLAGMAASARLGGWSVLPVLVGLALLPWIAAFAVFAEGGPLVPCIAPTLGLGFGSGAVRFWRGRHEQHERRALMHLFARFVSEPVAAQIWAARATFLAGGRPRPQELTATVLFSDIAGFTPICESLPPEPLIAWLDRYIDTMVQIVLDHEGIVLRFIGDGILAVFGAPLARRTDDEIARDAGNAARCALAMCAAMARLNAGWREARLPTAAIRIGIHTGPLVAGSLGNGPHMEYCLLGDTANTGARLEALGKEHRRGAEESVILVGEATWDRLAGFSGELIDTVTLRGRQRPIRVYRLRGAPPSSSQPSAPAISSRASASRNVI